MGPLEVVGVHSVQVISQLIGSLPPQASLLSASEPCVSVSLWLGCSSPIPAHTRQLRPQDTALPQPLTS